MGTTRVGVEAELEDLAERLHPGRNRQHVVASLDRMFASGESPDPLPSGFHPGRLVATSTWGPWDSFAKRVSGMWMPWLGKSFDRSRGTGINRFTPTKPTLGWLRVLFPTYSPPVVESDRIEAFPFRNSVGRGELDPGVGVFKIDYDFEANPALIRRILDEVVQVGPDLYLGKVLFRLRGRYYRIGFFSLRG